MNIREARLADAAAIAKVHVDAWQTTYDGLLPDDYISQRSCAKRLEKWTKRLNNNSHSQQTKTYFTYVAENTAGKIVGFVDGGLLRGNSATYKGEIYALYILTAYQRQGFGKRLVQAIATRLSELGLNSILVWALAQNPAIYFYQALGGQLIGHKTLKIGNAKFIEFAYGWRDTQILLTI